MLVEEVEVMGSFVVFHVSLVVIGMVVHERRRYMVKLAATMCEVLCVACCIRTMESFVVEYRRHC